MTLKNEAVSVSEAKMNSEEIFKKETDIVAKPLSVLMETGVYPRMWN